MRSRRLGTAARVALLLTACAVWHLCATTCNGFVKGAGNLGRLQAASLYSKLESRTPDVGLNFFDGLFGEPKVAEPPVVIKEDYSLAIVFSALGVMLCAALPYLGYGLGALILLLGILFFVQTGRVRFVFDGDAFELRTLGAGPELEGPGENIVVGGKNRWAYSSFVNWEFFPKGLVEKGLPPILVYFKETQTPESEWGASISAQANSPEALAKGAVPGMVHFFPAICDAQQIKAEFEKRGCKKITTSA